MARAELKNSWVTATPIDTAKQKVQDFLKQGQMTIVSSREDEIIADQGSQLTTRFVGGWLANPADFPKRATIHLHCVEPGVQVEATIEETLGFGWLDPKFKERYEQYFIQWMNALRQLLPPIMPVANATQPSQPLTAPSPAPTPQPSISPVPQPTYPQPPYTQYALRPPKDRGIALILEILPGLFGLLGFGWIYSGNTNAGILWLIGVLFWDFIAFFLVVLTAGFGCFCTVPMNLILIAVSASSLNTYIKQHPELFGG